VRCPGGCHAIAIRLAGVAAFLLAGSRVGCLPGSGGPGRRAIVRYALVPALPQTPRPQGAQPRPGGAGRRGRTLRGPLSRAGVPASGWRRCGVLMVLTCVAAVAVVWLALWGVIRLEKTMAEARLPGDGSPATRQLPGHPHPRSDPAARITRTCGDLAQPRITVAPSCPRPARRAPGARGSGLRGQHRPAGSPGRGPARTT
jgi:hypothetical protein